MSPVADQFESAGDCVRLVQITDTHLNRVEGGSLLGLDTDFSLQQVVDLVRRERSVIDLVLGTGDISDHGSKAAYERAGEYFNQLGAPVLWLVGNHDQAEEMAEVLGRDGKLPCTSEVGNWQIVMLNSQIPGEVGGRLGSAELELLEQLLASAQRRSLYSLVCLHHHPVPVGSGWLDDQIVEDREDFLALIDRFPGVKGVLWGHVHQQLDSDHGAVKLMSTPSSCIQFAPGNENFKVDDQPPGYRWLDLHSDGRIETAVSRVRGVTFEVDLDSSGYL
jgi:Icc protein